jgi:hypothetical protein
MIDLHSVVAFFQQAKWIELAIAHEITGVLGENTISNSTVKKYVRMLALSIKRSRHSYCPESKGDFSLHDRIVLVISEELFPPVSQIAKKVMMSKSTVYCHLAQALKWKLRHLKWVFHNLTESEK